MEQNNKNLYFNMRLAYEMGYRQHPQLVMKELWITYKNCESFTISDCWIFYDCTIPDGAFIPEFIHEVKQ